jgi:hypothetical protein
MSSLQTIPIREVEYVYAKIHMRDLKIESTTNKQSPKYKKQ